MPEAIETTKRRFYKALDSLSNTQPQSSLPAATSSTAKRSSTEAFNEARERVRKRLRNSTSTSSLPTLDGHSSIISLPRPPVLRNKNETKVPIPNFSPWSQQTFLARLKTFSDVSLWHPKPEGIGEVEWAKRGWGCVDVNTVACKGGCEKRVVVKLETTNEQAAAGNVEGDNYDEAQEDENASDGEAVLQALAERYKTLIVDGHSPACLWHRTGCNPDIYRLPLVRPAVWQPELRGHFQSLVDIQSSINAVRIRPLETSSTGLLHDLPKDILGLDVPPDEAASRPFELAMHGWRGSSESGTDLLHCDACFQRIGLWMYQPDYQHRHTTHGDDDSDEEGGVIDLVEMHRDHCPWRNPATQHATGSLSGLNACQVLQRVVSTAARDCRRRSNMQSPRTINEPDDAREVADSPSAHSRDEIARQDKERESRLRKLKNLFHIKRRSRNKTASQKAA